MSTPPPTLTSLPTPPPSSPIDLEKDNAYWYNSLTQALEAATAMEEKMEKDPDS
ncbi:hypothetical protein FGADI_13551, partial [Fusarium gaditjirri]